MEYSNKKKALLNTTISIGASMIFLIAAVIARRFFIANLGNEANGLYQLFISISGMLSIVELGIGTSIIFCMYEPIAKGDRLKLSALYYFFKKSYLLIGGLILVVGCLIMPFLPMLAGKYDYECNIYYCYFIALLSTAVPYTFSFKQHLINAHKDGYISSLINGAGQLVQYVLQIAVLIIFKSFPLYLWAKVIGVAIECVITQFAAKKYGHIIGTKAKLDPETKADVNKKIRAMFMHKIGNTVISTSDSIMISLFVGIATLGFYSNYLSFSSAMFNLLILFISPMTAILGHVHVQKGVRETARYLEFFHTLNFLIGFLFYLGYYAVIDNCINMFYGGGLLLPRLAVKLMVISLFVRYIKQAIGTIRDATGAFYYDRWKPVAECSLNIGLNVLFGHFWGIGGIFLATILSTVLVSDFIEPLVLHKFVLKKSPLLYYVKHALFITAFIVCIFCFDYFCAFRLGTEVAEFFARGFIAVGISAAVCLIVFLADKNFRSLSKDYANYLFRRGIYAKPKKEKGHADC